MRFRVYRTRDYDDSGRDISHIPPVNDAERVGTTYQGDPLWEVEADMLSDLLCLIQETERQRVVLSFSPSADGIDWSLEVYNDYRE